MTYQFRPAVREAMPLLIGLIGPTWTGKTFSALRLATGIVKARGGKIVGIDTEARRMLQYADDFTFQYMDFGEPFSSVRYAEAMRAAAEEANGGCVIVDSMSHEHEGMGGYLDYHEQEVVRLCKDGGFKNPYAASIPAWSKPSQDRRKLINTVLQLSCAFIFCFRAKEKIKPVSGGSPVELGWQAIAGDEFGFEMSARCLLVPGCKGTPDWSDRAQKLGVPKRIKDHESILKDGRQLSEDVGYELAMWAEGGMGKAASPPVSQETQPTPTSTDSYDDRIRAASTFSHVTAIIKDMTKDARLSKAQREMFIDRANKRVSEIEQGQSAGALL